MQRRIHRFITIVLVLSIILTTIQAQTIAVEQSNYHPNTMDLVLDEGFSALNSTTETGIHGLFEYEVIDNAYVSITDYLVDDDQKELVTSVIFPDTIAEYPVQRITAGVCKGFSSLSYVQLPNTLTRLDGSAFGNCTSLKSITLPASLDHVGFTSSGNGPFDGSSLRNVTFVGEWTKIPEHLFAGCGELSAITLPEGITEIGSSAFENCDKLSSITIPDGVTIVRECAFRNCGRLSTVNLPGTLSHLAGSAFGDCSSLTAITLPSSLDRAGFTNVGNGPFDGSALQNVTFAGEWTKIPEYLFASCGELSAITLPEGIAEIGNSAFEDCDKILYVVIPNSVHTIEGSAFDGCTSLQNIFFRGDAPSVTKASSSRKSFPEEVTLNYIPSTSGWCDSDFFDPETNTWNGYNLSSWNGIIQEVVGFVVPEGQYCIHVVDENGTPIPDALVTWEDATNDPDTKLTDSSGKVFFNLTTLGEPGITVTKSDYLVWTNKNSNWQKNENRYDIVILYQEGVGDYKLRTARYSTNGINWTWDLLCHTKKRSLGSASDLFTNSDEAEFWLACSAFKSENVARYELWQDHQLIAEDPYGIFRNISNEHFSEGGGCFIRVISNDGESVDTAINLEFAKIDINKATSINILSEKFSIKVSDTVPYVGGSTFEFDWPFTVPVQAAYSSDGKIMFGFNIARLGEKDDAEKIQEVKELVTKARNLGGYLSKQNYAKFLEHAKEKTPFKFFKNGQATLLGYAEADPGSTTATGYILLETKIDLVEYGYNTLVPVPVLVAVPVTVQIELSLDTDFSASMSYDWAGQTFTGALSVNPIASLKAFGGIGVSKLVGAGAYGGADLAAEIRVSGFPKGVQFVTLTGELGVKAYLGPFSGELPFTYDTWHIYTANTVQSYESHSETPLSLNQLFDASSYRSADLSYLKQESAWLDNACVDSIEILSTDTVEKTSLTPLLTGTYRNAQPVFVATEDATYASFLRADSESGDIYVVTSKFDGTAWHEPVRADLESFLDASPVLCAHNGKIYLAYAQTDDHYTESSLLSYARNQSIVVGTIDPDTLVFTKEAGYLADGFANMQQLSVVNGIPTLIWIDANVSDDNSVLFPNGGTIYYSQFKDNAWSDAAVLTTSTLPILSVTPGESDGELAVAYVVDSDGHAATHDDYILYQATTSETTTLASGAIGKVSYSSLPNTASNHFVWNDSSHLYSSDGSSVTVVGITDEYDIVGERIYYCAADKDSSNLAAIQYDGTSWSHPIQLTSGDRYLEDISVVSLNGDDYLLGMHTAVAIESSQVIDDKSLVWAKIAEVNDLVLEDVWYEESSLAAGETLTIEMSVANAGENTVNSIDILIDGISTHTENCTLHPGQQMNLSTQIICPSTLTTYTVSVAEPETNDYTIENNSYEVSVGYPDISVKMVYNEIGSSKSVLAYVTNEGISPASGTLNFHDSDGTLIGIARYSSLQQRESAVFTYDLSNKIISNGNIDISATAIPSESDFYLYNNSVSVHIGAVTHDTQIHSVQWNQSTQNVQVTCSSKDSANAHLAAFNKQGQLVELHIRTLGSGLNEIDQVFMNSSITEVRAFILDENNVPQCLKKSSQE